MTWIVEEPFWLLLMLVLVSVVAVIFGFSGAGKIFHFVGAGFFAAAIGFFVLAQSVVTDKEAIRATIIEVAEAVSNNDVEGAVSYFHPSQEDAIKLARMEMPNYEFETCNVTSIKDIKLNHSTAPTTAEVELRVFVNVNAKRLGFNGMAPRGVILDFQKTTSGEWKISNYRHFDPRNKDSKDYMDSRNPTRVMPGL